MSETFPVSPMPVVDESIDVYDYAARQKSKDEYYKEQIVRMQEITIVRDKLKWCHRREGVNHFQNCRHLTLQYMELIRELGPSGIKPYKAPVPKAQSSQE
ncbi:MAG: hypothetical protein SGCHY_005037 [Lobulomycetales sp.]